MKHYILAQNNLRLKGKLSLSNLTGFIYTQKIWLLYYLFQRSYITEWWQSSRRKKYFLLTKLWILICLFVLLTSLKTVASLRFQWTGLAPTESYARFYQVHAGTVAPKLVFQDNLTVFPNTLQHNTSRLYLNWWP